jgi:outer membrane lipoprotein-sorting protein
MFMIRKAKQPMFKKQYAMTAVVAFVGIVLAGDTIQEPPVMALVRNKYTKGTTLQTQFSLRTWWNVREKEETKQGSLSLAPGEKFRAVVGNDMYISDGESYWQYSAKAKQAVLKRLSQIDLSAHPSRLFETYLRKRTFTAAGKDGKSTVLVWNADTGVQNDPGYTKMTLTVTAGGVIKKLVLIDSSGNSFTYTFSKTVFGATIPQEEFRFETPQGASLVDLRD